MTYEDFQEHKKISIYSSYLALLCHQHYLDGKGPVLLEDMLRYKTEAVELADLALKGESK